MKYKRIPCELFSKNRIRFSEKMDNNSIAIFHSNDLMPKNADQEMAFKQNSDLFHLSGIDQEETILLIIKHDYSVSEHLFIRETNEHIKIWEGEKLSKEQASETSGITLVDWHTNFKDILYGYLKKPSIVYLNSNEHPRANIVVETRDARFKKWFKSKFPNKIIKKASNILYPIRAVKQEQEIALIEKACNITKLGVKRVLNFLKPGVFEYELEAEILHEFIKNRASGFAYEPIIASGSNACVLHYNSNNKICKSGDVVLMDFGAEYANYSSDLTRCFPVSGRFTTRQRNVYNSVLSVFKNAKKILKPGLLLKDYEKEVGKLMEKELVDLKLLSIHEIKSCKSTPAYKKYYMHGTSHHLGLDVHDVSGPDQPLCEGMVLTVEPGIYIPEEGIGIRLENDILIGKKQNKDLMEKIPIETEEIEDLLNI
ncbi:MAG: X-Pro aminopeptidase [Flavobacteriales bacterium]|jgi:Xaa-Pro aminopeptidase|nr:X-Pro aminopeptidase [Flavobacteriales bacterium]|tara:strand:+ start:7079 stop:8359 length:1281 start_codon:yes stop_codon:yes gene_type:complete